MTEPKTDLKLSPKANERIKAWIHDIQVLYDVPANLSQEGRDERLQHLGNYLMATARQNEGVALHAMNNFSEQYKRRTLPTYTDLRDIVQHSWAQWKFVENHAKNRLMKAHRAIHRDERELERLFRHNLGVYIEADCGVEACGYVAYSSYLPLLKDPDALVPPMRELADSMRAFLIERTWPKDSPWRELGDRYSALADRLSEIHEQRKAEGDSK